MEISLQAAEAFDNLIDFSAAQEPAAVIDYNLPYPKYLFLDYLTNTRPLILHGSNLCGLELLKPIRNSTDSSEFGNQAAIYATQDPFWALFFAVLNRQAIKGSISNGAIRLKNKRGMSIHRYFFTVEVNSLRKNPWTQGAIYILSKENFEADPSQAGVWVGDYELEVTHWIFRGEREPLASLPVEPGDFPFINSIWGYDAEVLAKRMSAETIAGWPFLDDPELYPVMPEGIRK